LADDDYWQKVGITLDWILGGRIPFEPENLFPWYNPDLPRSCNPNIEAGKESASYQDDKNGYSFMMIIRNPPNHAPKAIPIELRVQSVPKILPYARPSKKSTVIRGGRTARPEYPIPKNTAKKYGIYGEEKIGNMISNNIPQIQQAITNV
jgi:hypothetical protein